MISERAKKVDASGIRKVFELAAQIENPVNLSIGQPHFDVPEPIKQAAIKGIEQGFNRYTVTQGIPELREKICEYMETSRGIKVDSKNTLISSGVSGGLLLALMAIINPGDEIIFFDPYFVMYKHLVNLLGGVPVVVNSYPHFSIDEATLRAAVTPKTKAIIVNSPTNPTGYVYSRADSDAVIKVAKENDLLIISDEIYENFVYDGNFESPVKGYEKSVILGGFSKTYAMTGWRMGFVTGVPEIVAQMIKLQQYTFVCAPAPFQYACLEALNVDVTPYRDDYRNKRDFIYEGLKDNFDIVKPGGAFYIFPALKKGDAGEFVKEAIKNEVLIIPGNVFSEKNTNYRISFAATDETLKRGVDILYRISAKYQ